MGERKGKKGRERKNDLKIWRIVVAQRTQDIKSMLVYRWSTVYDAGPTVNQHRFTILCLLGSYDEVLLPHSTHTEREHIAGEGGMLAETMWIAP